MDVLIFHRLIYSFAIVTGFRNINNKFWAKTQLGGHKLLHTLIRGGMCFNQKMMIEVEKNSEQSKGSIIYFLWVFRIIKAGETALIYLLLPESHTRLG